MLRSKTSRVIYLLLTLSVVLVPHDLCSRTGNRQMRDIAFRQYDIRGIVGDELIIEEI